MVDITSKSSTLRKAIAVAELTVSDPATIEAIETKTVPKGDVFEFSRAAGLLAIKKTSDVIPDCHPLPVEFAAITCKIEGLSVIVTVEVHTIYKTGVEVEAMHGAAITALTMYDMLKPIDKSISINKIALASKTGGKSDFQSKGIELRVAVIVCSDSVAAGKKKDSAGKAVMKKLTQFELATEQYEIISDDIHVIQEKARELISLHFNLVLLTGGTGLSPRDNTPEAVRPLLDREIPGVMEAARHYGQQRTPYAMLSRGIAGFAGKTLLVTLPGSTKGAEETMDALFPYLLHVFRVAGGMQHD